MNLYQYKSLALTFKDIDQKQGIVSGYLSAFNVADAYKDVVLPGAFTKTIQEQGPESRQPRIKHLLNHDITQPIGKFTMLKEDSYGLAYESKIGTNSVAADFMKMAESDLITEHSIGYREIKTAKGENGTKMLLELKLMEGSSLTGWGVNQYTPMTGIKGVADYEARIKRLTTFVKNTDATDEAIEILLLEIKQLSQLIIDLKATPAETTLVPEPKKAKGLDANLILTYLSI